MQRELTVLRQEVAVRDLRDEVADARKQVAKLPAIAAQFDAEQKRLKAKQVRLEAELATTQDKLGKLRVNQSLTDYAVREMRKQVDAAAGASVEVEFANQSTHFQMKATHPAAAEALGRFALEVVNRQADGRETIWIPNATGSA
jgi:hypothetical protein